MINIILFGPPGSGKGTQSKKLLQKYNLTHLSTGDLFRGHMEQKTRMGEKVKEIVSNGGLVSDDITVSMIDDAVKQKKSATGGFLFDGFPRTLDQAISLDHLLAKQKLAINFAVTLQVAEATLRARIAKRKKIESRTDDDHAKLGKRIDLFFSTTMKAFPFYEKQAKLNYVDGTGSVDEVFDKICDVVEKGNA